MMCPMPGYEALRDAIVHGEIGADARLVEHDVSARFAMPRGAVRTALVRLEQEGLVVREPNRGARVRRIADEEAVEILEARAALEALAARKAAQRIDAVGEARLRACLRRHGELLDAGDLLAASDANAELHATLLDISGHRTAQQLIQGLRSRTVRFQFRTILVPGRPGASHAEHRAIVEAVVGRHPKRAERAMREHLLNVADALRGAANRP
jgi:DNA-binding GntR family transcriptional regulator